LTLGAASAVGEADVRSGREADESKCARHKCRRCVENVEVVEYPEIRERLIDGPKPQRVAQPFSGSGGHRGIRTTAQIGDGLLEKVAGIPNDIARRIVGDWSVR